MKKAEQEVEKQEKTLQDAEDEKRAAEREGRLVLLLSTFDPYFLQCPLYLKALLDILCTLYVVIEVSIQSF